MAGTGQRGLVPAGPQLQSEGDRNAYRTARQRAEFRTDSAV